MGKRKLSGRKPTSGVSVESVPTPYEGDPIDNWVRIGLGALLFVVLLLVYSNSFDGAFLLDNQQIILLDPRLRGFDWDHLVNIFTKDYWWPTLASDLYRPFTTFSYMLNWTVFENGSQPQGYHIFNFLLHAANVALVYGLLRQIGTKELVAYWAAAIFGLHPIATEGVTNIVGRADLWATFFVLSGTICYAHSAKSSGMKKFGWLVGMGILSIFGVLSKESGVMILPAMFFYDWLYRSHSDQAPLPKSWAARIPILLPGYIAVAPALITFISCRLWMMRVSPTYGNPFVDNPIELAGFFSGRMTAFKVLGQYCGMLVWPDRLSCDWSYNQIPLYGPDAPWQENIQSWIAIVLIISLFTLAWVERKRNALIAFGIFWFAVAIFPTSNLPITIGSIKGERLLYMPSLGFALIAGMGIERARLWFVGKCADVWPEFAPISYLLPIIIFFGFSVRTYCRNADWNSEFALWSSAVTTCPDSFKTYKGFSNCFITLNTEAGADQAIAVAEKGVAILENPRMDLPRKDNTLYINIAFHYARKAEYCANRQAPQEAMKYYLKALGALDKAMEVDHFANGSSRAKFMRQGYRAEEIRDVGNPTIYELRAAVFLGMNLFSQAEQAAQYNLRLNPYSNRGNILLAQVYARQNKIERAAIFWIRHLLFDPNSKESWQNLIHAFSILSPTAPAITTTPQGGYTLLKDNPIARRDLTQACVEIYQLLLQTLHFSDAANFRQKAIDLYGCPPELFPRAMRSTDVY